MKKLQLLLLVISFVACDIKPTNNVQCLEQFLKPQEGGVKTGGVQMINYYYEGDTFQLYTKTMGNNPTKKLLLLAGGPGCSHEYFECFESFILPQGIELIYYDQLGCGRSDNPQDTSHWNLSRSVEELEQLRKALGLTKHNLILLGHSWGGVLAMEYALKYQQHIKALVISNMMTDAVEYDNYAEDVLSQGIDKIVLDSIKLIESTGDYANPRYMELLMPHFYNKHICRIPLQQWPNAINRTFAGINQSFYITMQGPSEFGIAGKLNNWSVKSRLGEINIPCLVIGATYDTMDPKHMQQMAEKIKGANFLLCPNGSHMCMWDDQENYMNGLLKFIHHLP